MYYPSMDEALSNPGLVIVIAIIVIIWLLGTHFKRVGKRYDDELHRH